jgi:hypothetical protein
MITIGDLLNNSFAAGDTLTVAGVDYCLTQYDVEGLRFLNVALNMKSQGVTPDYIRARYDENTVKWLNILEDAWVKSGKRK